MSRIRELRKGKGYTQSKLGELIGADTNLISRWERGKSKPISLYIQKLAQALNTSADYLLGDTDDPSPVQQPMPQSPIKEEKLSYTREHTQTKEQSTNTGMLVYMNDKGERFEAPPTEAGAKYILQMRAASMAGASSAVQG